MSSVERTETSGCRIALYSQDGLGLGHMRRASLIAEALHHALPRVSILTLGDSPLGWFFGVPSDHEHVALPTIVRTGPDTWRTEDGAPLEEVLRRRQRTIDEALKRFRPRLLLVDHLPQGAAGELIPSFERLRRGGTRLVLGLRDILDAPEAVRRLWTQEDTYRAVDSFYDLVLIYGQGELFDSAAKYGLGGRTGTPVRYCGYVCGPTQSPLQGGERSRRRIVALAGGGADGQVLMNAAVDALPRVSRRQSVEAEIITGPFLPAHEMVGLERRAAGRAVCITSVVHDARSRLRQVDLVVCMAGYNTTVEALGCGAAVLAVPRMGPSAEQSLRAGLFADRGWLCAVDPARLSADRLAKEIEDLLDRPSALAPPDGLRLGGAATAAALLQELAAES